MKNASQRLKETYARMLDGELQGLASEIHSLSDFAKPLLLDELSRRGLPITPESMQESAVTLTDELDLVPVTQARTVDDLSELRDVLDAAQIPSFLGASRVPGWIGISVREHDEERAMLAIEQAAQQKQDDFHEIADHPTNCPRCGSTDTAIWANQQSEEPEPDVESKFYWVCAACQHEWVDDGLELGSI